MALFGKSARRIEELEKENESLIARISTLEGQINPTAKEIAEMNVQKARLQTEISTATSEIKNRKQTIKAIDENIENLNSIVAEKKALIVTYDEEILAQEFGLYEPRFAFAKSSDYKDEIARVRAKEKAELRVFSQSLKNTTWTVNNSSAKGRKMVSDIGRLLMTAYNSECDAIISKVKHSNIDRSIQQIEKSAEKISKFGYTFGIEIPSYYVQLKVNEARLSFEWSMQKEKEREELREAREREREARKLEREIAAERKKLEKEKKHYTNAYNDAVKRLKSATGEEKAEIEKKLEELKVHLTDIDKSFADVDYREANQKAGFVYIISNIGSFGENVYKIGMTRRLDPMDRVRELSDASVPFDFDVHALIFSNDAPALEASLHRRFEDRKVNLVNHRREFFTCTLEEIEETVKQHYDRTVEFTEVPDAEQYRISKKMREQQNQ